LLTTASTAALQSGLQPTRPHATWRSDVRPCPCSGPPSFPTPLRAPSVTRGRACSPLIRAQPRDDRHARSVRRPRRCGQCLSQAAATLNGATGKAPGERRCPRRPKESTTSNLRMPNPMGPLTGILDSEEAAERFPAQWPPAYRPRHALHLRLSPFSGFNFCALRVSVVHCRRASAVLRTGRGRAPGTPGRAPSTVPPPGMLQEAGAPPHGPQTGAQGTVLLPEGCTGRLNLLVASSSVVSRVSPAGLTLPAPRPWAFEGSAERQRRPRFFCQQGWHIRRSSTKVGWQRRLAVPACLLQHARPTNGNETIGSDPLHG
jgi:hypothetical protein